jgi:Leucine-rich repeat (LRR) protein
MIGPAQGRVAVTLRPHEEVLLDFNSRFLQHPDAINSLSPDAIDIARLQCRAMDDSEMPMISKAVSAIARLKKLKELEFTKSDITDQDLLKLNDLSELERISAEASYITGASLAKLTHMKNIREFYFQTDLIKPEYLFAFAGFPKLEALNLSSTNMTGPLRTLAGCSNLKYLRLNYNHQLDDSCISSLLKLTKLQLLELKGTTVTVSGLEKLKRLPLKILNISSDMCKTGDLMKLRSIFGKILAVTPTKSRSAGDFERTMFAPTSRD